MSIVNDLYGAARRAPEALGAAVETMTGNGDHEDSDTPGPAELAERLGSIDDAIEPLSREVVRIRESADLLRTELIRSREEITALKQTAVSLNESMARLTGEVEHVLDRVPGLSPKKARRRAEEIKSNDGDEDGN